MLAHKIHFRGFVGAGGGKRGLGEQLDLQRHQVAEDARQSHNDVDPRPTQLLQRDQLGAGQTTVTVKARGRAQQSEDLPDRRALGLEVVGAPEHNGDGLGQRIAVGHVAVEDALRLLRTVLERVSAGDAEGVEAVDVAPGRQNLGGPQ